MPTYNIPKLEGIVANYKAKHRKQVDYHIVFCIAQSSLKDCINVAATAIDDLNKIHFHQVLKRNLSIDQNLIKFPFFNRIV